MSKKGLIFTLIAILNLPIAYALDLKLEQPIAELGRFLSKLLSNHYAVYFLVALFLFILLNNLFKSALEKTHFGGSNSKPIAFSLAALSTIAIVGGGYYVGFQTFIDGFVTQNSLFPAVLLAIILFIFFKNRIGWKWASLCAGLGLLLLGGSINSRQVTVTGILCIIIFLFAKFRHNKGAVGSSFGEKFRSSLKNNKNKGVGDTEDKEDKLENKEASESKDILKLFNDLHQELMKQINNENPLTNKNNIILILDELIKETQKLLKELLEESALLSTELEGLEASETDIEGTISAEEREKSETTDSNVGKDISAEESISKEQKDILKGAIDDAKQSIVMTKSMEESLKEIIKLFEEMKIGESQIIGGDKSQLTDIFNKIGVNFNEINQNLPKFIDLLKQHHELLKERRRLLKSFKKDQKEKTKIERVQAKDENKTIK